MFVLPSRLAEVALAAIKAVPAGTGDGEGGEFGDPGLRTLLILGVRAAKMRGGAERLAAVERGVSSPSPTTKLTTPKLSRRTSTYELYSRLTPLLNRFRYSHFFYLLLQVLVRPADGSMGDPALGVLRFTLEQRAAATASFEAKLLPEVVALGGEVRAAAENTEERWRRTWRRFGSRWRFGRRRRRRRQRRAAIPRRRRRRRSNRAKERISFVWVRRKTKKTSSRERREARAKGS